jgi:hypothetical protein
MISKIFSPKVWRFLLPILLVFEKSWIVMLLKKSANFFAENWQKSTKVVIIYP